MEGGGASHVTPSGPSLDESVFVDVHAMQRDARSALSRGSDAVNPRTARGLLRSSEPTLGEVQARVRAGHVRIRATLDEITWARANAARG